ncbi:beta-mannosidase [Pedobacter namyangjuensis]|uniref:beta-mannosidase n=1 Tax=Pedobacter namyangjuensis TaxID=600626 RepID=UPI000DE4A272|nr:glycoside hydrolase family 2 protein [Pedobacter namyangjuensis]
MFKKCNFWLFVILLLSSFSVSAQVIYDKITQNWQFNKQSDDKWYPAKVPGEVHLDLLRNKLIDDPFYRDNEKKLQWIEKENWNYKTTFDVSSALLAKKHIDLVFDGLDTYAEVYLNDKPLLKADNMFRQWSANVKALLKKKGNKLLIKFQSAQNKVDTLAKADAPFIIPDNARAYVRKAQFHFGWDWGPKLTGAGIWKEVRLEAYQAKPREKPFQAPVKTELVQEKDEHGASFYFKINGKPVYMKGANYIPADAFVTRTTKADYRKLLMMAKEANMNMLRVWGGGIYENDDFYNLCDSLGIYVWQDFMFAGQMVPGDDAFFENVKQEVKYQVKRLRHHKSIVLWCGNNEIDEAWNRWGWQKQFNINQKDSVKLWTDYKRLFRDSIPKWVKEVDPSRPYISTSPKYGWGVKNSFIEGDSHYWGVWWGNEDFETFENKTGRFVSEYGMQAMPNYESVLKYTNQEDRFLYSDILKNHQKANNGFQKLDVYLKSYLIDSARLSKLSVEDYTYLTQCVQYYGFKNMILIHRSKSPYNMGTLLWQLNDCWPVASWSITDYYDRAPKAAWYAVKNAYQDVLTIQRDSIKPKDLKLSDPKISYKVSGNKITLKSSAFAKYVFVDLKGYTGKLSDNYFDLEPGIEKTITFSKDDLKTKVVEVKIKTLWDVVH